MPNKTTDGTPDAGKLACPVRNGGKGGDYFKALPIINKQNASIIPH